MSLFCEIYIHNLQMIMRPDFILFVSHMRRGSLIHEGFSLIHLKASFPAQSQANSAAPLK